MMSFEPFWNMMREQGITIYELEYDYELNPAEINRLKHNHNFTLQFINKICFLFKCQPNDVICYIETDEDKVRMQRIS